MSDTATDTLPAEAASSPFADVLRRARRAFARVQQWESTARTRWLLDYKFANGDDENNYQWPDDIYQNRETAERPSLTINKVRQHNLLITNDAKQQKQGIKYRPVGDGATQDAAEVAEGIVRHVENISHAQDARGLAITFQIEAGLGFTYIDTKFVSDKTFDQDIYILPVTDPMSCYLCEYTQPDGSAARAFDCSFEEGLMLLVVSPVLVANGSHGSAHLGGAQFAACRAIGPHRPVLEEQSSVESLNVIVCFTVRHSFSVGHCVLLSSCRPNGANVRMTTRAVNQRRARADTIAGSA